MKINKGLFKRITSLVLCTTMLGSLVACSNERIKTKPMYKDDRCEIDEIINNDVEYFTSLNSDDYALVMCDQYDYDIHYDLKDFNKMVSNGATWEDVISSIANNKSLDKDLKEILSLGVINLCAFDVAINLDVLKYNIDRLTIEYVDDIDANDSIAIGKFDAHEHKVYIDNNLSKIVDYDKLMCHEILGHGSTQAYVDNKLFRNSIYITQRLEGVTQLYSLLGFSYEEAAADYIAHMAINKKLNNLSNGAIYAESLYFFLAMCEALDITPNEYLQDGIRLVANKCIEKGYTDTLSYIMWLDLKNSHMLCKNNDYGYSFEEILFGFVVSLINDDKDMTLDKVNKIFDSYKEMIIPINENGREYIVTGLLGTYSIDIELVRSECIKYYNENKNIK